VPEAPRRDFWQGLAVPGALARRVADAALFVDAVADGAPGLAAAAARPPGRLRVAVSLKVPPPIRVRLSAAVREAVERVAARLRGLGHLVEAADPDYSAAGFATTVRYLRGARDAARELGDPTRLCRQSRGYARLGAAVRPLTGRARAAEAADAERLNHVFDRADVVLMPVLTGPPLRLGAYEGRPAWWTLLGTARWVAHCPAWNHTGQPALALPAGPGPDGLPVGVQLVGRPHDEATLVALGAQLEAALGWPDLRPALTP
jgi:amidase